MRNFILVICTWQILITLSTQLAIEDNKGDEVIEQTYEQPEIYIDHIINPEEVEFEEPQLSNIPLNENVREKRHTYKILESPGLHSRFRQVQDEDVLKIKPHQRRYRRSTKSKSELHSDEVEDVDDTASGSKKSEGSDYSFESIVPQAQKQTMNPAYYRSDDSRLMDKWVKAPYGDFQARVHKEEDDSQSEQSSNVGIKTRTPRVNFITQQGESGSSSGNKDEIPDGPEARERERERERDRDRDQQSSNNNNNNSNKQNNNDDSYRKPVDRYNSDRDRYYPYYYNKYDTYDRPLHSQYPPNPYNPYYNRDYPPSPVYNPYYEKYDPYYDRYYERNGIAPPPAGMSRLSPPQGPSSSFYYRHNYNEYDDYMPRTIPNYYYSDKRFEIPMEPRGPGLNNFDPHRQYLVNNEVYNRPSRIVYYANLPEIVRTPNNYRSGTARYADPMYNNYNYYNNYDDFNARTARTANLIGYRDTPPSTTMRISSTPVRSESVRERNFYG